MIKTGREQACSEIYQKNFLLSSISLFMSKYSMYFFVLDYYSF